MYKKPALKLQTTTLWDYPSQHYGPGMQGDQTYVGATPSYVIWNLLERYTRKNDLIVDPMCGSGTTLDVAKDLERRAIGYDLAPYRADIQQADARKLPLGDAQADFVFIDPPYSTHVDYSDNPACIGKLDAQDPAYYEAMEGVIREIHRILKPRRYMALYCSDSYQKKKPFSPIGFRLFGIMEKYFTPADIVCVTRHNKTLKLGKYHSAAIEGNFFLRGFNYLFIMKKDGGETGSKPAPAPAGPPLNRAERRKGKGPHPKKHGGKG